MCQLEPLYSLNKSKENILASLNSRLHYITLKIFSKSYFISNKGLLPPFL